MNEVQVPEGQAYRDYTMIIIFDQNITVKTIFCNNYTCVLYFNATSIYYSDLNIFFHDNSNMLFQIFTEKMYVKLH